MEIKTKVIIIETIICLFLGYMWMTHPKVIEKKITQWRTSDATITGATNATIGPDGAVGVSGPNLTIKKKDEERKTDDTKYNFNAIYIDALAKTDLSRLDVGLGASYVNRDFKISGGYYFVRPEYFVSVGKSVLIW